MAVTDSPGAGRVLIALADGPLVAEPTWTRYDEMSNCRCHGFDWRSGRQSELDKTDTGSATVFFHDRAAVLDDDGLIGLQIMLQLWDPVAEEWVIRWRGHIDDISTTLSGGAPELANVQMDCLDIFDYLGGAKFVPGSTMGDPGGPADVVFYENERVDDRIIALCADAQLATTMRVPFEGNTFVNETQYDADDVILTGLRDAADAEFPGVANVYVDRYGRLVFHGRLARFEPEAVEAAGANWDFVRWEAATREDVTMGVAQIREFGFNRPRSRIINSFLAWPRADENGFDFDRSLIPSLVRTDPTSIALNGWRAPLDSPDLIIKDEYVGSGGRTGIELCGLFGDFYIENYAVARKSVQRVTFKSIRPGDARAAAAWALMCGVDISDAINLTVDEALLADEPFFVDGVSGSCRPLNPEYDFVTVTPNLTPASYYGTDVFSGT